MESFRLQRENDLDLVFDGELLAHVSSESDQPRWTEIDIWRTDKGRYVVRTLGLTKIHGEVNRITVRVVDTPDQLAVALRRKDTVEYLTYLALDALEKAASKDSKIAKELVERI